ncbi:MAG: alpha-hydroxy acid oxidase [Burkholderiaceae bacterium]
MALQEFVSAARDKLPAKTWDYLVGATETETSQLRNRLALDQIALRPRVLNDVSQVASGASLFGKAFRLPLLLPPIGGLESFHPDGAAAVAQAAAQFNVPMMLSSVSKWSLHDVKAAPGTEDLALIYQLYVRGGPEDTDQLIEQAIEVGSPAFCITVDSAVYSRRERDIVSRFVKPWRAGSQGDARHYQAAFSWSDLARIRAKYQIPLVLKGIATAEDALIAVEHGVEVIYVSNHGGRQLDYSQGSMSVLPEVVAAVDGRATIIIDGGFCRGTDIVKALALGADAVGCGRLMCFALAAAGAEGIVRMLEILELEYQIALALTGVTDASQLTERHVALGEPAVRPVSALSGFPLL